MTSRMKACPLFPSPIGRFKAIYPLSSSLGVAYLSGASHTITCCAPPSLDTDNTVCIAKSGEQRPGSPQARVATTWRSRMDKPQTQWSISRPGSWPGPHSVVLVWPSPLAVVSCESKPLCSLAHYFSDDTEQPRQPVIESASPSIVCRKSLHATPAPVCAIRVWRHHVPLFAFCLLSDSHTKTLPA